MLILADTNIWVDHLHAGDDRLAGYLRQNRVVIHPMIIGELACGSLKHRQTTLPLLQLLPRIETASDERVMAFLQTHQLYSKGSGWVDMHLLCAVSARSDCRLWTRDIHLQAQAERLNLNLDDCQ